MQLEILTRNDLQQFKSELLAELKQVITPLAQRQVEYLKGKEVKKLLKISDSTLQSYRDTGKLASKKIGGIYFYPSSGIEKLFNDS